MVSIVNMYELHVKLIIYRDVFQCQMIIFYKKCEVFRQIKSFLLDKSKV